MERLWGRFEGTIIFLFLFFIDPRYEWSIFSGPGFQTLPSQLLIGSKNVARGKLWQNPRDELQNTESSVRALHQALPKALLKALQHLYPPSILATQ